MTPSFLLAAIPGVLLCAAFLSLVPLGRKLAPTLTVIASLAAFALAGVCAFLTLKHHVLVAVPDWIGIDGFGALLLMLVTLVGFLAALFSSGYMAVQARERTDRALRGYHVNFNLFLFSIVTVPMMQEVALTWIAIELTTIFSILLVSFESTSEALEAAWKYVILTMIGAGIALLGVIIFHQALLGSGPFTWDALVSGAGSFSPVLVEGGFILFLAGFGVKVGLVPLHTWLPDAHSQAPTPVCAILSGVETSAILYVVLRIFPVVRAHPELHLARWATIFGLISVGAAAFLLIQVRDIKRLFAFSTVEQMGIILTAAGLSSASSASVVPYQILTHGLAKSLCFFAAGSALIVAETREIAGIQGLIRREPVAGAALLVGSLAVAGAPPFALFLSELSIVKAGLASHYYAAVALLVFFIVVAFGAILYHVNRAVFGTPPPSVKRAPGLPRVCALVLVAGMALAVAFGVWLPPPIHSLIAMAGSSLGGLQP